MLFLFVQSLSDRRNNPIAPAVRCQNKSESIFGTRHSPIISTTYEIRLGLRQSARQLCGADARGRSRAQRGRERGQDTRLLQHVAKVVHFRYVAELTQRMSLTFTA